MNCGLDQEDIQSIQRVLATYPFVKKAILYGSRAKGTYQYNSDIDLTLLGENLTLTILFEIENELDDLLLPYKIDLSIFHKISNPYLVDHINRVGVVFYEQDGTESSNAMQK
ncbi:MAG: nucleotidyltransferase domain-containing protein [Bacteroidetes bacterium]|nr:nucleotidyltransferase domain-containing protein [Bacteroidota bacterium]